MRRRRKTPVCGLKPSLRQQLATCSITTRRGFRHGAINDVVQRALSSAGFQAVREPNGVHRDDGIRPDGMTRIPWSNGRSLVWDVTVVDTLAQSHIASTSSAACAAADKAEELKKTKYRAITEHYLFTLVGPETLGSWGAEACNLVKEIGRKLAEQTEEPRATSFLTQKISIELQRGNASSILGTFPNSRGFDEIFTILKNA